MLRVVGCGGGRRYLLWAATTFKYVLDCKEVDVYWCTADCGWITGHTYIAYGPTALGATQASAHPAHLPSTQAAVPTHPGRRTLAESIRPVKYGGYTLFCLGLMGNPCYIIKKCEML